MRYLNQVPTCLAIMLAMPPSSSYLGSLSRRVTTASSTPSFCC